MDALTPASFSAAGLAVAPELTPAASAPIRISRGLRASAYRSNEVSVADAVSLLRRQKNLYEVVNDDVASTDPAKPVRVGFNRLYGDIDDYAQSAAAAALRDGQYERALRAALAGTRFALMCSTGLCGSAKDRARGLYKVSWRFVLPDIVALRGDCKRAVMQVLAPRIVAALKAENYEPATDPWDDSVYGAARKMRMLGSTKDGENRPLRLVAGEAADTFITWLPGGESVLYDSRPLEEQEARKPAARAAKAATGAPLPLVGNTLVDDRFAFLTALSELVPLAHIDDRTDCLRFIRAMWREEQSPRMLALISETCKKSPKYCAADSDGNSADAWVRARIAEARDIGYTVATVIYWVQTADRAAATALFKKYPRDHAPELFSTSLAPANVEEYADRFVRPLPLDRFDTVVLQSALGTGKTVVLMGSKALGVPGLLSADETGAFRFPRVLFVSGRKSFTAFARGELAEEGIAFDDYREKKERLSDSNRLFIQVESLWKLADGFTPYDLLVLDESETIAHQLHSVTTHRENMVDNHVIFERLVTSARKVFVADAFTSDRSLSIVQELRNRESTVLVRNTFQPYKREAILLAPRAGTKDGRAPNVAAFIESILRAIEEKRRIIIVWTSKKQGLAFEQQYLLPLVEKQGLRYKFYHGASPQADRRDLFNVGVTWRDLDVLMYTTAISVGVSYNPGSGGGAATSPSIADFCAGASTSPSTDPNFDQCFLYACAASAAPRDVAQALLRCRVLRSNKLTYVVDTRGPTPSILGLEGLRLYLTAKKARLQAAHPVLQWRCAPKWADLNFLYNENEVRVSRVQYLRVLHRYLVWCGYTLSEVTPPAGMEPNGLEALEAEDFEDIPAVDDDEAEDIRRRQMRDEAEPMERLTLKKYYFLNALKPAAHADVAPLLWEQYMGSISDEAKFWNVVREKHTTTAEAAPREKRARYVGMACSYFERRNTLDKLLAVLDVPHSCAEAVITHADMAKALPALAALEEECRQAHGLRTSRRKDNAFTHSAAIDLLKTALTAWNGSKPHTTNQRQVTMLDETRSRIYDYVLPGCGVWEHITERTDAAASGPLFIVDV